MKLIPTLLLLAVSCTPMVSARSMPNKKAESSQAEQVDSKAQLQLTTSLVERNHHCSTFMGLKVLLTFENTGSVPIIFDKRSFIIGKMISRTVEAAEAKKYETTVRYDLFDGAFFNVDPPDMSNFIILKPGEVYEKTRGIGSFRVTTETPPPLGYLNPGTHYLQIQVNTWSYFTHSVHFEKLWSDKGVLWLKLMTSMPMPFTAEKNLSVAECH
jgi:hypothetical protein